MEWEVAVIYVDQAVQGDEKRTLQMTLSCLLTVMK